jgi:gamma-glutamylcyclotransferase (GGCT)/AIG2-like uncharacterized protein YtfP
MLDRQWQLRLEQARYQVHLAQRQYDAVDPENRLVAGALEKRWNEALLNLDQLEQAYAQSQANQLAPLTEVEQQAIRQLAACRRSPLPQKPNEINYLHKH